MIRGLSSTHISAGVLLTLAITISCFGFAQQLPTHNKRPPAVLPITHFYDIPNPWPAGQPGHLIRSQSTDDYDLPENVSALRILFHSRTAAGQDVPASGVVLVPDGKPPRGAWPVLAWAQAFCDVPRDCAPSLRRNLLNGPFLTMYARLGYAVVATDYAGTSLDGRAGAPNITSMADGHRGACGIPEPWTSMGSRWRVYRRVSCLADIRIAR